MEQVMQSDPMLREAKNMKNCILVLDDRSAKIIDWFMNLNDLLDCGIIGIESLTKKWKWFLNY